VVQAQLVEVAGRHASHGTGEVPVSLRFELGDAHRLASAVEPDERYTLPAGRPNAAVHASCRRNLDADWLASPSRNLLTRSSNGRVRRGHTRGSGARTGPPADLGAVR